MLRDEKNDQILQKLSNLKLMIGILQKDLKENIKLFYQCDNKINEITNQKRFFIHKGLKGIPLTSAKG
jgi:hypothetical protein